MNRHILGLFSLLAACAPAPAPSQTPTPAQTPILLGKASHEAKYVKDGQTFSIQLYSDKQPSGATTLYAWPTFAFKADPAGKLAVNVEPPLVKGRKSAVKVTLLINPAPLLNAAKVEFALKDDVQVVNVLMRQLSIGQQSAEGDAIFLPLTIKGETVASEITLVAYLPGEEADALAKGLRDGAMTADFRVAARLYSSRESGKVEAEVRLLKLQDIDAVTVLLGQAGTAKVGPSGNALITQAAPVTRDQDQKIRARIKDDAVVKFKVTGKPAQVDALHQMIDFYLDKHVFAKELPMDITVENILKLNKIGFDHSDLKPDVISKTIAGVKQFLADDKAETISFEAGGSLLGIGSASAKFNKRDFRKHLEDRGWHIEQKGTTYVPRSINVRAVHRQAIEGHQGFSLLHEEATYSHINMETVINTRTRINPEEKLVQHSSALAPYTRKLVTLRAELDQLEARRVNLTEDYGRAWQSLASVDNTSQGYKDLAVEQKAHVHVREHSARMVLCLAPWVEGAVKRKAEAKLSLDTHRTKQKLVADEVKVIEEKVKTLIGK